MAGLRQRRRRAREKRIAEKHRLRERAKLETLRKLQTSVLRGPEPSDMSGAGGMFARNLFAGMLGGS